MKTFLLYSIGIFSSLFGVSTAAADGGFYPMMMGRYGYEGGMGWLGFVFMLIFWGVIIYLVVLAIKSLTGKKK